MRYNRSCLDSFKKESTRGFQPSSEEKPSFPHGDLRIAVQKHSQGKVTVMSSPSTLKKKKGRGLNATCLAAAASFISGQRSAGLQAQGKEIEKGL